MLFGSTSVRTKCVVLCFFVLSLSLVKGQTNADPGNSNSLPGANEARAFPGQFLAPTPPPVLTNVVDQGCLGCLCLASTGCKAIGCHLAGPGAYYCGSYLVSWAYWADAGKPGDDPTNPYAFERCLNNSQCAEQTIQQYMSKYGRDCNGDGRIDCSDYARIHKAGPSDCQAAWVEGTTYWQTFLTCNPSGGGRPVVPVQPIQPVQPVQPVQPQVQPVVPPVQLPISRSTPSHHRARPTATESAPAIDVRAGNRNPQLNAPIPINV